ncbi:MAG: hypothetical protein OEY74_04330 [Gammaproteobacteria bacterium]|nr:hypothetical protein [Gammaproteobacteria bacterium]
MDALRRLAAVGEDELGTLAPSFVDDPAGNRVEHDDALLAVLGLELVKDRQDENARAKLGTLNTGAQRPKKAA